MNILVTGGAGFLGSHLCDALLRRGYNVICVDNFSTGSEDNIRHHWHDGSFRLLNKEVVELLRHNDMDNLDAIYHLASPTSPAAITANKEMTRSVNSRGTCALLELADRTGAKFLFVSSVKVNGECERVSDYIYGKRIGEELCSHSDGAKVARLANTYGPRMAWDDSRVIPTFITRSLQGKAISLWNGGSQIDSFCYASDIVRGLILFMESEEQGIIEFGAKEGISIAALAEAITTTTNPDTTVRSGEIVPVSDECHKVVDGWRAKALLGWEPSVSLGEGLKLTIDYFRCQMARRGNHVEQKDQEVCVHTGHQGV